MDTSQASKAAAAAGGTDHSAPEPGIVVKSAAELEDLVARILRAAGASEANAARVAEALVSSDLCGVVTHGLWQLPGYVTMIQAGEIDARAYPRILEETPATALVSGAWTFGHVGAKFATEVAIRKAEENGVSVVALVEVHHIGRLGEYVEMAAARQMISMMWLGGLSEEAPAAVPYGGRTRVLHTNPIAMGFPAAGGYPVMFDFATTAVSGVKVVEARDTGHPLPPGCIVDRDGAPTTRAADFFEGGGHLPFGGHKGYAFMLASEYLGRIFTGSERFGGGARGGAIFGHSGATLQVMRADLFRPLAEYSQQADEMRQRLHSVPPAPSFQEVLVPGDLEARNRAERTRNGIPLAPRHWQEISDLARSLGVAPG